MSTKDQEPAPTQDAKPKIDFKITYSGQSLTFRVRASTVFQKVFETAYKQFGVQAGAMRFTYNGQRVRGEHTPLEVGMLDDDDPELEAHIMQEGGA